MKKITAKEFLAMIEENPSVFEHWETPLQITETIACYKSKITHLSPHLTFTGRDINGKSAHFENCPALQIATGTFHHTVYFLVCGIKKIENLNVTMIYEPRQAAAFYNCPQLKVATGNFNGYVCFLKEWNRNNSRPPHQHQKP
jgi:hypothetical protein